MEAERCTPQPCSYYQDLWPQIATFSYRLPSFSLPCLGITLLYQACEHLDFEHFQPGRSCTPKCLHELYSDTQKQQLSLTTSVPQGQH